MDVRQLNTFVHIVELKSFTKAAEHLRIAQPALGLQIRKLEEELQVQLLVRHSRGVEPTDAGLVLLDYARDILERFVAARSAMVEFTGPPRGRVMLGLTPSINYMISTQLIKACNKELPHIVLSIEEQLSSLLVEWVDSERLDMCLAHKSEENSHLIFEPLFHESLYFICHRGLLAEDQATITLAEVASHSLIMPGMPHGLRKLVEEHAAKAELELDISFEMQSVSVVRDLVAEGVGATILPYGGARRSTADGDLMALKIEQPTLRREIYLCYHERRAPSAAEKKMRELIRIIVAGQIDREQGSWTPI